MKDVELPPSHIENSGSMELMIESVFLSELLQECWFARGHLVDVLHSTVDAFGYDVVLQAGEVVRHVQLKAKKMGGTTNAYAINTLLGEQPAGCVICIVWEHTSDENRMSLSYHWLGGGPNEKLTGLGDRVSRNSRGNAQGVKGERVRMRDVRLTSFTKLVGISELADRLFGEAGD